MNQHGFPRGYHFVPSPLELLRLLDDKLAGRPLPHPLPDIFHELRIRDFHPAELYEEFREHEEAGFIYFFSQREFPALGGGGKKLRPARGAKSGGWKASGGGKAVTVTRNGAGVAVGQKLTMVFYQRKFDGDKDPDKTDWGMHEFTRIVGPDNKLSDTAVYRLYKMRSGKESKKADRRVGTAAASSGTAKLPASPTVKALPSPCQTARGTFMTNQASMASTSQAQAQATAGQPHHYQGRELGRAAASAPGPSSWMTPAAANQPAQLHGAGGHAGLTGSPVPAMASGSSTAAHYPPTTTSQQQQAADHFQYARLEEWHKMLQMVSPPPPPPPPLVASIASGPATAAHELATSQQQQQAAEPFGHRGWNEQEVKMALPPPLPPPAPVAEGYLGDEFDTWYEMQQATADHWFPMAGDFLPMLTDEEQQQCTFTIEELLGLMDEDKTMPAMVTVTEEAGASNPTPTDNRCLAGPG